MISLYVLLSPGHPPIRRRARTRRHVPSSVHSSENYQKRPKKSRRKKAKDRLLCTYTCLYSCFSCHVFLSVYSSRSIYLPTSLYVAIPQTRYFSWVHTRASIHRAVTAGHAGASAKAWCSCPKLFEQTREPRARDACGQGGPVSEELPAGCATRSLLEVSGLAYACCLQQVSLELLHFAQLCR